MRRTSALCTAAVVLVLLCSPTPTLAVYDFGPIKPRGSGGFGEGFPLWYRDNLGRICEPCFEPPSTAKCLTTRVDDSPTPPDEFFYFSISGEVTVGAVRVTYENAVEGAYANGPVVAGDEMVFTRTRIRIDCPTTTTPGGWVFTVSTPYEFGAQSIKFNTSDDTDAFVRAPTGKRCVSYTSDVGLTAGNFAEALAGPVTSYAVAPPSARTPGQYGNFPTGGPVTLTDATTDTGATMTVTSNAFLPSPQEQSTTTFISSCKQYTGSTASVRRAVVTASDTAGSVEVWAEAGTGPEDANLQVSVNGVAPWFNFAPNAAASLNTPVPQGVSLGASKPVLRFARFDLASTRPTGAWEVPLVIRAGPTSSPTLIKHQAAPAIFGDAIYDGSTLTITITATDSKRDYTFGTFNPAGVFGSFEVTPAPAPQQPAAGRRMMQSSNTGRKLLQSSTATGNFIGTVATAACPSEIWVCPGKDTTTFKRSTCVQVLVRFSSSGFGTGQSDPVPVAKAPDAVSAGQSVTLDGSGSTAVAGSQYKWTQVSGTPAVTITNVASPDFSASFTAPTSEASLVFQLQITSGTKQFTSDTVTVKVIPNLTFNDITITTTPATRYINTKYTVVPSLTRASDGQQVTSATFKVVDTTGCSGLECTSTASTQTITVEATLNGKVVKKTTITPPLTIRDDQLTAIVAELRSQKEWRVDATSEAAAASNSVTMKVYNTGSSPCTALSGCANARLLGSATCDNLGACRLRQATTDTAARGASVFVLLVTSAGNKAFSAQARVN